jgi:hypothetical protein
MKNLFTNQKETDRAIRAAINQFRKVLKKNHRTHCSICGCTPKPDEWSFNIKNRCFDCA